MALRGVWQLQKLVVNFCDWGGSSKGIRYCSSCRFDSALSFVPGDPTYSLCRLSWSALLILNCAWRNVEFSSLKVSLACDYVSVLTKRKSYSYD
uniref:Uncharacterized protein n=1 Tax=Aegilops tauschii subsp. strangulata TaxID=200361 RepID=A0A453EHM7_AEGTS